MNTSAEIALQFGNSGEDGYFFALKARQIEELQRKCGPLGEIATRLLGSSFMSWQFRFEDVAETIRLGLIGGGMAPTEARQVVDTYVDVSRLDPPGDPSSPLAVAKSVIAAVMFGMEEITDPGDDKPGKTKAGAGSSTSRRTARPSSKPE
ncbi:gene transfer agent family protein [Marinicauda sp. Alg238-R41]|uniref:gene transfer agent family protein n=1 Tax=Marinicauda sp. Alg238-R41 TaxID=2993447 RepID=UPI0022E212F0|nr:gene transfer agent family protein [Marinicauda sp. Alg238-R41]